MGGVRLRFGGTLLGAALVACGATPATRLAARGDHAALRDVLAARQKAGDLSSAEAASLAKTVAERELGAAGPLEAAERVREVRACARELDGALAARMAVHDEAGAAAALARLDAHRLSPGDVRDLVADDAPYWRAVGVRALVASGDQAARQRALLDPSPLVRRQAARACRDAADGADLAPLAEAARVDPEPLVRTEAVRALAVLPPAAGADVATRLRDLWAVADDGLREDIAFAWSQTSVWAAGGRDALRVVVASGRGPAAVDAAAAVLRRRDADAEVTGLATGALARAIEGGPRPTRLQALAEAPLDERYRPALWPGVEKAASDDDLEVSVSALARLASAGEASAVGKLEALAQPGSPVGERARFALAVVGDRRVQLWLEQDLSAESKETRLSAATSLASLGLAARAAALLADPDASVRLRAACTIVGAARVGR
jgi:hypothetical protein